MSLSSQPLLWEVLLRAGEDPQGFSPWELVKALNCQDLSLPWNLPRGREVRAAAHLCCLAGFPNSLSLSFPLPYNWQITTGMEST